MKRTQGGSEIDFRNKMVQIQHTRPPYTAKNTLSCGPKRPNDMQETTKRYSSTPSASILATCRKTSISPSDPVSGGRRPEGRVGTEGGL